jgi:ectoine hydroxylase-related dioxygenase (phytanoyl-CoA dioxygenase family)
MFATTRTACGELRQHGYTVLENVLDPRLCAALAEALPATPTAGSRRLLDHPLVAAAVVHLRMRSPVASLLPRDAVATQCIFFSKSDSANWLVPPHQDLAIPVAQRVEHRACSGWSEKEGQWFVQPPADLLARLLAVRIQLDDLPPRSGELRVAPGSHRLGRLPGGEAPRVAAQHGMRPCPVPFNGALLMRPLLVHASSKAPPGVVRRVLHLLFGPSSLPCALRWARTV